MCDVLSVSGVVCCDVLCCGVLSVYDMLCCVIWCSVVSVYGVLCCAMMRCSECVWSGVLSVW